MISNIYFFINSMYYGMNMFYTGDICKGVAHDYIWFQDIQISRHSVRITRKC